MGKGKFINQKLGKRTDRKSELLKARLKAERPAKSKRLVKNGDPRVPSR